MKRLCIDPGHGMTRSDPRTWDPGAIGGGFQEAVIVMDYALAVAAECEKRRVPYWLTRKDRDEVAPLHTRVSRAMTAGCDVFVSLHCNSVWNTEAHGTETLYRTSPIFAAKVHSAAIRSLNLRDRGIKNQPNLAVLQFPGPCALIELGFISNARDRGVMVKPESKLRLATELMDELTKDKWL